MTPSVFDRKFIVGMVHLLPLPGASGFDGNIEKIEQRALEDAEKLFKGGVDALIIENFGDEPYDTSISLEAYSVMLRIADKVQAQIDIPFGVNVQFNCIEEEWAMSYALGADFLRAETYVETRFSSYGRGEPSAARLQRLKKQYPSDTMIFADINGKHTYGIPGVSILDAAHDAKAAKADAVIITGKYTGQNPSVEDIKEIKEFLGDMPVLVGSGANKDNAVDFLKYADGIIVGSSFKVDGDVYKEVDLRRVQEFMDAVKAAYR
ncbi:MAG: BtpA/SgcQ family protein [Erysipelotrichaceae bacterium]|nr:BtpA/SgcQ family protein [Erysipelotrichaceae bacterium]